MELLYWIVDFVFTGVEVGRVHVFLHKLDVVCFPKKKQLVCTEILQESN